MPTSCAVAHCNSPKGATYHAFPSDPVQAKLWMGTWCKKRFVKNWKICSNHFKDSDYKRDLRNELLGLPLRKIFVDPKNVVPSQNLFPPNYVAVTANSNNGEEEVSSKKICHDKHERKLKNEVEEFQEEPRDDLNSYLSVEIKTEDSEIELSDEGNSPSEDEDGNNEDEIYNITDQDDNEEMDEDSDSDRKGKSENGINDTKKLQDTIKNLKVEITKKDKKIKKLEKDLRWYRSSVPFFCVNQKSYETSHNFIDKSNAPIFLLKFNE